jgi:hypothetical protein
MSNDVCFLCVCVCVSIVGGLLLTVALCVSVADKVKWAKRFIALKDDFLFLYRTEEVCVCVSPMYSVLNSWCQALLIIAWLLVAGCWLLVGSE